jgi:hypothetical protein
MKTRILRFIKKDCEEKMRLLDYKVFALDYYMEEWFLEDRQRMKLTKDMNSLLGKCFQEGLTIPMAAAELATFVAFCKKAN